MPWMSRSRPTLAIVLALAACATPRSGTYDAGAPALRIMSYNIHAGTGGLENIAAVIRDADADVVTLQEVDVNFSPRSHFVDQADSLARLLGMDVRFAPIYELPPLTEGAPPRAYGLALLSRLPVTGFTNHVIPRLSSIEQEPAPRPRPGFLAATVRVGDRDVRIFNTHLDYRGDPRVRVLQIDAMLAIIGSSDLPTILTGDLNAEPHAPELQPLLSRFHDAWLHTDDPGLTFPAATPVKRIDYILHSAHLRPAAARVPATTASDHRPVLVTLRFDPR